MCLINFGNFLLNFDNFLPIHDHLLLTLSKDKSNEAGQFFVHQIKKIKIFHVGPIFWNESITLQHIGEAFTNNKRLDNTYKMQEIWLQN